MCEYTEMYENWVASLSEEAREDLAAAMKEFKRIALVSGIEADNFSAKLGIFTKKKEKE